MDDIPERLLGYLSASSLTAFWVVIRKRLESNGLSASGAVTVEVNADGADRLDGLLVQQVDPGRTRVKLDDLDAALRRSAASANLAAVTAAMTGSPLTDRRQAREDRVASTAELISALEQAVVMGPPVHAQAFVENIRLSGLLTKAGKVAATQAIAWFALGWAELTSALVFDDPDIESNPVFGLGELATIATGTAHGFDEGRLAARLMVRALAMTFDEPVPAAGQDTRRLWERAGVATDDVSGTAMTWGFRPPGNNRWATMMRERADLGLVTHLTVQELRKADDVTFAEPGSVVYACENPQILSAAARSAVTQPLVCLSGQGSAAAWQVLRALIRGGVTVRYHGDFDWPGVLIVNRVLSSGGVPWRMGADDYTAASITGPFEPLDGARRPTPWDEALSRAMDGTNAAVHEEAVVNILLGDLLA
ncbi:DUF2399 domain-containing protein [Cryobacterium melibiosiphilum]|uniref:DUF2399 domain-containing protein n=1 Tax=Cryobacterium melibiosiphilum TaxID=995039 RepID=A0A3A5N0U3_9MICO|nr:DUF2399 domain-containing protein [Cryobacterium melibiosiphilum]RJT91906.1 DUF2399 domain-containing protein [Cryobacterium melibiosiphilum]